MATENRELFSTSEFAAWAYCETLSPEEQFVLNTYLKPEASTLEAGCGGGRLLLYLQKRGFTNLTGYDIVPELIEEARKRDSSGTIRFEVQSATQLPYRNDQYDQLVYLQQILSIFDSLDDQKRALQEAHRVLKPGGTILFSLLAFEVRSQSGSSALFVKWLRLLRRLKGSDRSIQWLPWLRRNGKFNPAAFRDQAPYTYWFRTQEAEELFRGAGFEIEAVGSNHQIAAGRMCASARELDQELRTGAYYFVCRKPAR